MNKRIRKKKGLSKITDKEVWGLCDSLGEYILPRLIRFKQVNVNSYPANVKSMEDWHKIIDEMIWAFDMALNEKWSSDDFEAEMKRFRRGMLLFGRYYWDLWD